MAEKHLPVYGVGPYLVATIALMTFVALALSSMKIIPIYNINQINTILLMFGIFLIIAGVVFWLSSVAKSRIDESIRNNDLVTTGIYGYIRHPIYAAFLYILTGIIVIYGNILLFILSPIFWAFLTISMIKTEEKWLIDLYVMNIWITPKK